MEAPDPSQPRENRLLRALAQHPSSQVPDVTTASPPVTRPPTLDIHAPILDPATKAATDAWLLTRDTSADDLPSAKALVLAVGLDDPGGFRRRLKLFRAAARVVGLAEADLPDAVDIRHARNWPRVYAALARVAQRSDADGWAAACEEAGASPAPQWRDIVVEEAWHGDGLARELVQVLGECTIVVGGSQGAGKSATVSTLLGRPAIPHSHALVYHPGAAEMRPGEADDIAKLRHLAALNWPSLPIERNLPKGSFSVDKVHVKLDGRVLSFIELPSMDMGIEDIDEAGAVTSAVHGSFDSVVKELQGERPKLVLLVERLDEIDDRRFKRGVHRLQRLFGRAVLSRLIVVLTHGQSLPVCGMSYDVWSFDQVRRISSVVRKFCKELVQPPIVVIENSASCNRDGAGRVVLPDGTAFMESFMTAVREVAGRMETGKELTPLPTRRWWEAYVVVAGVILVLMRIR